VTANFLDDLKCAAQRASEAEDAFRREVAAQTKSLERDRAFAHRRLSMMRDIDEVIAPTATEDEAIAAAAAALRLRLGWPDLIPARSEVL
jgi:hypothetical protein